jgi:hypothetical protein
MAEKSLREQGVSVVNYSSRHRDSIDVEMTYYELTQRQRAYERSIRARRRDVATASGIVSGCKKGTPEYDAAYRDFQAASLKLRYMRMAYTDFSKSVGLLIRNERTQAYGFDCSISAKAVWARKKAGEQTVMPEFAEVIVPGLQENFQNGLTNPNNQDIIGITTANGIEITRDSFHSGERSAERGVSQQGKIDALVNPLDIKDVRTDKFGRHSQQFIGREATVNINPDTGVITTEWKTGKTLKKKLEKGDK